MTLPLFSDPDVSEPLYAPAPPPVTDPFAPPPQADPAAGLGERDDGPSHPGRGTVAA